ncbi:hydrolase [Alsobacter metallidurans]|uniref:Hydrolase n=1 Tax=Alsobacter metallidurans TaxID=340221 RepID=A0A917IDC8_9HYPH|nr:MBL fold metallo-hydrolase [Alsobacter metallidurans]GGH34119.1 hydrolase [Alsobacter metallidurans]
MPPFKLLVIPVTPFQQNCSVLVCASTNRAAVVDPGGDLDQIRAAVAQTGATVEKILLTHGHIDHAGGAADLADQLGVAIEGPHRAEEQILANLPQSGLRFGITGARAVTPGRWLDDGDVVTVGALAFDVLHCPGHSPGSVVFVWRRAAEGAEREAQGFCLMGDVLFRGSVGRTDLPGGSHEQLLASIRAKILPLGDEVAFLPGHGPMSTIGQERVSNPYLV